MYIIFCYLLNIIFKHIIYVCDIYRDKQKYINVRNKKKIKNIITIYCKLKYYVTISTHICIGI